MFATLNFCFVVQRDRTSNATAHWGERENGSHPSEHDARMPCRNRRHSLADRKPHRERKISRFDYHLFKIEPGDGGERQPAARRSPAHESRPHRTDQKGDGTKTESGKIKFSPIIRSINYQTVEGEKI